MADDIAEPADGALYTAVTGDLGVPDIYANAVQDYVLYRAYTKDSEYAGNAARAQAHYAAFAPTAPGVFDTVLWNEAGEITECTFGNIAALLDGRWTTPPLACGLLPGVGRAVALRQGRVTEAVLRVDDVPRVQAWAFINSLRGWLDAQWVG